LSTTQKRRIYGKKSSKFLKIREFLKIKIKHRYFCWVESKGVTCQKLDKEFLVCYN
jgi:hypothetical protein